MEPAGAPPPPEPAPAGPAGGGDERWKHVYRDPSFAARYAEKRARGRSSRRREAAEAALVEGALDRAGLLPGARVLDCPAGTGRLSRLLQRRGARVTAADIALAMLEAAPVDGHPATASPATFAIGRVVADALRLPFPDRTFAGVVCVRLLHHVPTDEGRAALLRELARVSSGWVLVSFFHAVSWHEARDRLLGLLRPFEKTRHATTLGALASAGREAGLELVASYPLLRFVKRQWFALFRHVDRG